MASLIKKIVSGADRIPEGLQRAQATIQGMRRSGRYGPHTPFFRPCDMPFDQKALSLTFRTGKAAGDLSRVDRRVISYLWSSGGFFHRPLLVVVTPDLMLCIPCGSC